MFRNSKDDLIDWALLQDYKKLQQLDVHDHQTGAGITLPPVSPLCIDDSTGIEPLFGSDYLRKTVFSQQVFEDLLAYWSDKLGPQCPECNENSLAVDDYLCPLCRANLDA